MTGAHEARGGTPGRKWSGRPAEPAGRVGVLATGIFEVLSGRGACNWLLTNRSQLVGSWLWARPRLAGRSVGEQVRPTDPLEEEVSF